METMTSVHPVPTAKYKIGQKIRFAAIDQGQVWYGEGVIRATDTDLRDGLIHTVYDGWGEHPIREREITGPAN